MISLSSWAIEEFKLPASGRTPPSSYGYLEDKRAVEPLITALKDQARTCESCAGARGQFGDKRAVEPMIALLKDE